MNQPIYGMRIEIWRTEDPGITLNCEFQVGEEAFADNPALQCVRENFHTLTASVFEKEET